VHGFSRLLEVAIALSLACTIGRRDRAGVGATPVLLLLLLLP
jgi:hypothetical protein